MAEVLLKNIKKIYPIGDTQKKQRKFLKKAKDENPETNKVNLQITDEGVVESLAALPDPATGGGAGLPGLQHQEKAKKEEAAKH